MMSASTGTKIIHTIERLQTVDTELRSVIRQLIRAWEDPGPKGSMYEMPRAVSYAKSVLRGDGIDGH